MRLSPVLFVCAACYSTAIVQAAESVPESLRRCAALPDNAPRLACFDELAARTASAGQSAAQPKSAAPTPVQEFGLGPERARQLRKQAGADEPPPVKSLTARISAIADLPYGRREFTLDNGEVWQQAESQIGAVIKVGDAVTITPGALGSFWMQTGSRQAIRAKRVR